MSNLMRALLIIAIFFNLATTQGQPVDLFEFPTILKSGKTISSFIPDGWTLLDSTSGDLNGDNRVDFAFVIQSKDSLTTFTHLEQQGEVYVEVNKTEKSPRRILLITFRDSLSENFNLIEQNNTIILSRRERGKADPFEDIKIEHQLLKIFYLAINYDILSGSASTYFFRYQNSDFMLVEADRQMWREFPTRVGTYKFDFINQIWSASYGDPNQGHKPKTIFKNLDKIQIQTIRTFKRPYMWNVTEDIFL